MIPYIINMSDNMAHNDLHIKEEHAPCHRMTCLAMTCCTKTFHIRACHNITCCIMLFILIPIFNLKINLRKAVQKVALVVSRFIKSGDYQSDLERGIG